jgi:hypothetical protein
MKSIMPSPEIFSSVLGIPKKNFDRLLPKFSKELRKAELSKYIPETDRKRSLGGGRKATFSTDEEKLFFILFYYKVYPTLRLAEYLFGFDHTNILRWKDFLEKVLNNTLKYELVYPTKQIACLQELIEVYPVFQDLIIDATERPVRRPMDKDMENLHFSGKKKDHTIKNQLFINPKMKRIVYVSQACEGRKHDKRSFEEDKVWTKAPPGTTILTDGGYPGIGNLSPYIKHVKPFRKEAGKKLTNAQKETNKTLSSIRISVENVFGYMKHFNILRHDFRNNLEKAQIPFETIACVYNFTR